MFCSDFVVGEARAGAQHDLVEQLDELLARIGLRERTHRLRDLLFVLAVRHRGVLLGQHLRPGSYVTPLDQVLGGDSRLEPRHEQLEPPALANLRNQRPRRARLPHGKDQLLDDAFLDAQVDQTPGDLVVNSLELVQAQELPVHVTRIHQEHPPVFRFDDVPCVGFGFGQCVQEVQEALIRQVV